MKIKRRKRHTTKFRLTLRRRLSRKTQKVIKTQQCIKIIDQKACQICGDKSQDQLILLCDECDDAYHWPCLGLQEPPLLTDIWLCPNCKKLQQKRAQQATVQRPESCHKCHKDFNQVSRLKYKCGGQAKQLILQQSTSIQCMMCFKTFHPHCFSGRSNSINCWECQIKIRSQGPKNHVQYLQFLKNELISVKQKGFVELKGKQGIKDSNKRAPFMGLRPFQQLIDWELIARHQASLYYAIKGRKLTYCDEQLYTSQQQMNLNDSNKQIIQTFPLHKSDEQVYEYFKSKIRKGAVGPFEIKQDRIKGFYLVSIGAIQKGTIICEYVGQIFSHRASLNQGTNERHDSVFTLLLTGSSKGDLNIIPKDFGNIGRFICGVNNSDRQQIRKINVVAVRFSHQGRMRVIFVAKKNIKKGQTLYLNYNGGTYEEYPTHNFIQ